MRRTTFDEWFCQNLVSALCCSSDTRFNKLFNDAIYRYLRTGAWHSVGVDGRPRHEAPLQDRVIDLEARLARLECPEHVYETDKCVKCGKPKGD